MSRKAKPSEPPGSESPAAVQAMVSPRRDLQRMRQHSGATAEEVRVFLQQLQGKTPKEMLGAVATSHLVRGTALAAAATVVLLLLGTAIPFALQGDGESRQAEGDRRVSEADVESIETGETTGLAERDAGDNEPSADAAQETADELGVGQQLDAPSDVNPLDNAVDDLLEDLE